MSRYDDPDYIGPFMVTTIARETRTAKYPHKCYVCGQAITPTTRYSRIFSIVDGEAQVQKFHGYALGECVDIRNGRPRR